MIVVTVNLIRNLAICIEFFSFPFHFEGRKMTWQRVSARTFFLVYCQHIELLTEKAIHHTLSKRKLLVEKFGLNILFSQ